MTTAEIREADEVLAKMHIHYAGFFKSVEYENVKEWYECGLYTDDEFKVELINAAVTKYGSLTFE